METNYRRGRRKEYKILKGERDKGFVALRSAGSHSPIDIISIDVDERVIRAIQCKPDDISSKAKQALLEANSRLNGSFFMKFEVV